MPAAEPAVREPRRQEEVERRPQVEHLLEAATLGHRGVGVHQGHRVQAERLRPQRDPRREVHQTAGQDWEEVFRAVPVTADR